MRMDKHIINGVLSFSKPKFLKIKNNEKESNDIFRRFVSAAERCYIFLILILVAVLFLMLIIACLMS